MYFSQEPTPEICVYNEISQEDFEQMQEEQKLEDAKEKPLFATPPIPSVTTQVLKVWTLVSLGMIENSEPKSFSSPKSKQLSYQHAFISIIQE